MGKIRVNQLSKELGISNNDLVLKLQEMGYPVKTHSSALEDYMVQEIRAKFQVKKVDTAAKPGLKPTVIRRPKKIISATEMEEEPPIAGPPIVETVIPEPIVLVEAEEIIEPEPEPLGVPEPEPISLIVQPESPVEPTPIMEPAAQTISTTPPPVMAAEPAEPEPVSQPELVIESVKETILESAPGPVAEILPTVEAESIQKIIEPSEPVVVPPREEKEAKIKAGPEQVQEIRPAIDKPPVTTGKPEPTRPAKRQPGPPAQKQPVDLVARIKRIEKVTAEPARVISRPKPPEIIPPPPPPEPPRKPVAEKKPAPEAKIVPEQKHIPEPRPIQEQRPVPEHKPIPEIKPGRDRRPPIPDQRAVPEQRVGQERKPGFDRKPATDRKPGPAIRPGTKPGIIPGKDADIPVTAETKKRKKKKTKEFSEVETDAAKLKIIKRREVIERVDLYEAGWERATRPTRKAAKPVKRPKKTEITVPKAIKRRIKVMDVITVAELARKMGVKAADLMRKLIALGLMVHVNQPIEFDTAVLVAAEFGYEVEKGAFDEEEVLQVAQINQTDRVQRPPVVTVMGHVDHGKTSLLDAIRHTNVTKGEAGGITQHIGAYNVEVHGKRITFLDTPGHAAFTSMRARGAQVTDIVVLVVAADDGVMQQTREAADHAKAAGVPIIVAVNKIDKPEADPERIRREMADIGLMPEAWGGDTIFVDISAKQRIGLDDLQEMILLQSEILELRAADTGRAQGRVVEARLDKGRGPVATVLIQKGRLKQGDPFVCGIHFGKIRAMFNDLGLRMDEASPSMPVEIHGISGVPNAGDEFVVVEDEKQAKQVSQHRALKHRETEMVKSSKVTLENLFDSIKEGGAKELNIVFKADVHGSLEAITEALNKLSTDEIKINIVHTSTGAISETDIMLASASQALVVGFNVRPNPNVQELADSENIQVRFYDVIYQLIDDIKAAMAGLLEPIRQEKIQGHAEVRQAFHISKIGTIAGSAVTDGKAMRGAKVRLLRDGVVVYDGRVSSLRRIKDDVREVASGFECGIGLENYNDIKVGDVLEFYTIEEVAATLA